VATKKELLAERDALMREIVHLQTQHTNNFRTHQNHRGIIGNVRMRLKLWISRGADYRGNTIADMERLLSKIDKVLSDG